MEILRCCYKSTYLGRLESIQKPDPDIV
jgi:hypothetical protein